MKLTFKKGDLVRVTNIDGWESNGEVLGGIFKIEGIGDIGIVVDVLDGNWPIEVEHDYGTFAYKESELELMDE